MTEPLIFERQNSRMGVFMAEGHWHVTFYYRQPIVRDGVNADAAQFGLYAIERQEVAEDTLCVEPTQLLNMLTPDETQLLVGYCAHVLEQGTTHLTYLYEAVGEALGRKDWGAIMTQLAELYDEVRTHEAIRSLAADILRMEVA